MTERVVELSAPAAESGRIEAEDACSTQQPQDFDPNKVVVHGEPVDGPFPADTDD